MASIDFGSGEQRESLDDILSDPNADVLSVVHVTLDESGLELLTVAAETSGKSRVE